MNHKKLIIFIVICTLLIGVTVVVAASEKERREYAALAERMYLDNSMDVEVEAIGDESKTLQLKWVLMSRVVVHHFINNTSVMNDLRQKGFLKVRFTDGYRSSWTQNLR